MPNETMCPLINGSYSLQVQADPVYQDDAPFTDTLVWQMPPADGHDTWTSPTWTVTADNGYLIQNIGGDAERATSVRCDPFKAVLLGYMIDGIPYDITITAMLTITD